VVEVHGVPNSILATGAPFDSSIVYAAVATLAYFFSFEATGKLVAAI
jgi:hypothetical protein